MKDFIWLAGEEEPIAGVELVSEGAREIVYERDGQVVKVATTGVKSYRHGDTPGELDHALVRMEKGDFACAERLLAPLAEAEGWVRAHAGYHLANARKLRAELEGTGHEEALALLDRWRTREGEHFFAPFVALAAGEAALEARSFDRARIEFARLAGYGDHVALAARLGLARVKLVASEDPTPWLAELAAIEEAGFVAHDLDVVLLAKITRASALGRLGAAKEGLGLLLPIIDKPGVVRSSWHGAVLNTIATLVADFAGRAEDGSATPAGRVAASYYINRALRYTSTQPVERARTLALAVEANTLSGRVDIAVMAKTELGRRFATSKYYAKVK